MRSLNSVEYWQELNKKSHEQPQIIFKHSSACPISLTAFESLKKELKSYNVSLLMKPLVLVRTKGDIVIDIDHEKWENIPEYLMEISAVSGDGIQKLIQEISNKLEET